MLSIDMKSAIPAVILFLVMWACACRQPADANRAHRSDGAAAKSRSQPNQNDWFVDRAAEAGLGFVYFNGMVGIDRWTVLEQGKGRGR
jgi:hypothetical protein